MQRDHPRTGPIPNSAGISQATNTDAATTLLEKRFWCEGLHILMYRLTLIMNRLIIEVITNDIVTNPFTWKKWKIEFTCFLLGINFVQKTLTLRGGKIQPKKQDTIQAFFKLFQFFLGIFNGFLIYFKNICPILASIARIIISYAFQKHDNIPELFSFLTRVGNIPQQPLYSRPWSKT